jgi:hypothetical protein
MNYKSNPWLHAPSQESITKLERYCGFALPDDYKEFLMSNNGGTPVSACTFFAHYEYVLERFLALIDDIKNNPEGYCDIMVIMAQIEERLARDPDSTGCELIPIGALFAGDFVRLDYRKGAPTVSVWDHDQSGLFEPYTYHVANSFSEFLGMLQQR